ncbi:MAG TPA: aldehyde dehydrogenase family protein, partial [Novosphingobium sp.]|nr:aldehyde dehydrogenase family protein [Novosphingobium sp.]
MMDLRDRLDPAAELPPHVRQRFYIDGAWRAPRGTERLHLVSPLSEEVILSVPAGTPADMADAVAAAARAFAQGPWPAFTGPERAVFLRRMGQAVARRLDLFGRVWTAQVGVPTTFAQMVLALVPRYFAYYADLAETCAFEDIRPTA